MSQKTSHQQSATGSNNTQLITTEDSNSIYNAKGDITFYNNSQISRDIENSIVPSFTVKPDQIQIRVYDRASDKLVSIAPVEGKIYSFYTCKGVYMEYMLKDDKIHVEYTVIIPNEVELKRKEETLSNGWRHAQVDLKWNASADMIFDNNDKLQQFSAKGGIRTNHKLKQITVGHLDKITK